MRRTEIRTDKAPLPVGAYSQGIAVASNPIVIGLLLIIERNLTHSIAVDIVEIDHELPTTRHRNQRP